MGDILAAHAASQPSKLAIVDDRPGAEPVTYTFAEANERANQYAALLVDLGVTGATKVVWCGQNSASRARRRAAPSARSARSGSRSTTA